MDPTIPVGALIVSEQTDITVVNVDDIICFRSKSTEMYGKIITHRVVEKMIGENGEVLLLTKGDANPTIDGQYVDSENYVGRIIYTMSDTNVFADIISFLTSKSGFVVCIALPVLLIAGLVLRNAMNNVKRDMARLVEQVNRVEAKVDANTDTNQTVGNGELSAEEYQEMYERIKSELIQDIMEELKQRENREETK